MDSMTKRNIPGYKCVFAVIIIRIFNRSVTNVFGLMFDEFFQNLKSSPLEISFVSNLTLVIYNFTGIFSGFLLKVIPVKIVTIVGTIFVSCGLMLTSLVSSFGAFIFTYSILVGIGIGLISISCLLAVVSCFKKERNRAVSISLMGSTIGDIVLPQIVGYFLMYYETKTAVFVVGALALSGTFSAMLFPPGKLNLTQNPSCETTHLLECPKQNHKKKVVEKETKFKQVADFMDLELLKDKRFLVLMVGISIGYTVSADFALIFPLFLKVRI